MDLELKYVDFEVKNGIAFITMNNPEKMNAFTIDSSASLTNCLEYCSDSDEVKAVVIRGANGNFCGGGDIKGMKYKVDNNCCETRPGLRANNAVIKAALNCEKPIVAWIEGACAGGGVSLSLACDITIAQEDSKFVFAFVNIGFVPDMGSNLLLARAVGKVKATELVMLGNRFTGKEAAEYGIITKAVPAEELEAQVMKIANKLAKGPTLAYAKMKKLINRVQYENLENVMANEAEYQQQLCKSEDHAEAIRAFFEKRRPDFQGK